MKSAIKIFGAAVIALSLAACSFLDISDEAQIGMENIEDVFNNVSRTKGWYGEIYKNVFNSSRMWSTPGMANTWPFYTDELYSRQAAGAGKDGDWSSTNVISERWETLYESIRQCNIFLEYGKPLMHDSGTSNSVITEPQMNRYKANVRFMRAYYYFSLMEMYGPVPLITKSLTFDDDLDTPRAPLDELIAFIDTELRECMEEMEPEPYHTNESFRAVPTKGTALALRAKLWVVAASPLFNGGFTEALSLRNHDGAQLFPAEDQSKWELAARYCRQFLDYAEQGNRYELYRNSGTFDPEQSVYELHQTYNTEIIWATAHQYWGSLGDQNFETFVTPRSETLGQAGLCVLQELVDDFYMADGYPIRATSFLPASASYSETGFSQLDGYEVNNMYVGREPRFYNTVTFSGKKWHVSNNEIQLYYGGNAGAPTSDGYPHTGYFLYKRANRTVHGTSPGVTYFYRAPIIYRLAEFYLLYAEALNEWDPSNPEVLHYLNLVRERAGLPAIESLNPAIAGNKALQRAAIQRESRIELATEGQRYFDVRRWMIAENPVGEGGQGGTFTRMNPEGDKTSFHTRMDFQTRVFRRKNYLYPISKVDMQRSQTLVQNPGWE